PLSPGPYSFITPRRRGGGGRWTSLHESTSVSPPLLISLYSIPLSIFLLFLFALSTQAQEHFPRWHLHCPSQSCILYHRVRPILVSVTTPLLLNMFSLCVCDLCMCVCELHKIGSAH